MATMAMTVFFQTKMDRDDQTDGGIYARALFYAVATIMFNGISEIGLTIQKLPIFYKQRDFLFFPSWAYALSAWILQIPVTFLEAAVWVIVTYYEIGFDPNFGSNILKYAAALGKPQAVLMEQDKREDNRVPSNETETGEESRKANIEKKGTILPFEPHSISFNEVTYSVGMLLEMKDQGATEDRLVLLKGVSGAFRLGVLTALVGVSGAGKTTLMDVLAG
ncbi:pleiotropic drug resistance 1 [Olea europaea subsp. europaea]|uniref:Pleiotropic drug resistance 1 n=1 Tax=Olea europaea subsp. europaea TaxID=158383 RepID=A0A8S0UCY2_OLEEU|nr:pleiotropic drug resistance 1 [Olea europaea subsp. europaea]